MRMYSLYDSKSMQFTHPFGQINDLCALRILGNEIARKDTPVGINPEDFILYYIGDFDEQKGVYMRIDKPILLKRCEELVKEAGAA